jgi:hypothetical protein
MPRYPKMHPCGGYSPVGHARIDGNLISNKGYPTTRWSPYGYRVKIDILAQGGLAAMRDAKQWLSKRGIDVDLAGLEP